MADQLPRSFPRTLTIKLQEGRHAGQKQLWAPFEHEGKAYKLVVSYSPRSTFVCEAGETWEVYAGTSPNGHIVFCQPSRLTLTKAGMHPVIEKTARHVQGGHQVTIEQMIDRHSLRARWTKNGTLSSVVVEDGVIKIALTQTTLTEWSNRWGTQTSNIDPFVLEIPDAQAVWNDSEGSGCDILRYTASTGVYLGASALHKVTFCDFVQEGPEELLGRCGVCNNDHPLKPMPARRYVLDELEDYLLKEHKWLGLHCNGSDMHPRWVCDDGTDDAEPREHDPEDEEREHYKDYPDDT